ncbi:MAG: nodulation protein NfeD [Methanothrix sp.]|nr:nodulation protein NfeD [Methanothrix sp.]
MEKSRSCSKFVERAGRPSLLRRQTVAFFFLLSLLLLLLPALLPIAFAAIPGPILAVDLNGPITPASDDIVAAALQEAKAGGFAAVMLLLDTPGGGLTETYEIQRLMEEAELPVIGYVYPAGAAAWSAGTLILISSDVAAMAPHCIIGSAQPVRLSSLGEAEPINDSKTTNAIVALIEEKARAHGRNTTAAREFVISNLNLNAVEAKKYGVVEYIAASPEELMSQINGSRAKNATLLTEAAEVQRFSPPINLQILKLLSDPTLAGLLMLVGLYALIFGLSSPGIGSEALGVAALALGLIGLGYNVNMGAVFLLLLGLGLILAELHSHSFGILAVAGLICVIVGSILFVPTSFPQWYVPGGYQQSMALAIILPSLILGAFLAVAIYKIARARFAAPVLGHVVGEKAEAIERLDREGYVLFQGEYWQAEAEGTVEKGEMVVITGKDGVRLKVRR